MARVEVKKIVLRLQIINKKPIIKIFIGLRLNTHYCNFLYSGKTKHNYNCYNIVV